LATCGSELSAAVADGRFRSDLFYRLQVLEVRLPPLRERTGDLPALTAYFTGQLAPGRHIELTEGALLRLESHPWPGNLRELRNALSHAVTAGAGAHALDPSHLPAYLGSATGEGGAAANPPGSALPQPLRRELSSWLARAIAKSPKPSYRALTTAIEAEMLSVLMRHYDGKLARLANELDANRTTLRRKLKLPPG
jgi:DNA-binding NtrC family response regulator